MNEGNGRMSTTKKEGSTTEDSGANEKQPRTTPRRNILRAYATRS
jgi:hypothetical protein